MIRIEQDFHSYTDAAAYKARYLSSFPPRTFGTVLRIGRGLNRQGWTVTGQRFPTGTPAITQGAKVHQALDCA
jgi:hypothetical protein